MKTNRPSRFGRTDLNRRRIKRPIDVTAGQDKSVCAGGTPEKRLAIGTFSEEMYIHVENLRKKESAGKTTMADVCVCEVCIRQKEK